MSLQWEPQWEETKVEYKGIRLIVLVDRVTGLYACPICGVGDRATYTFTVKDLVLHMYAHTRKSEKVIITSTTSASEEERGEDEEE